MKILKRAVVLFLAAAICIGATACSGPTGSSISQLSEGESKNASSEADAPKQIEFPLSESVTMSLMAIPNSDINLDDTIAMKKMQELTNLKWDIQTVASSDLTEKRNLLLASNQYPDAFMKAWLDQGTLDKYGRQGTFVALNDLIESYAPNLTKLLGERDGVKQAITSSDGNIYALPEIDMPSVGSTPLFINQGWLDKLGLKMPTSIDEFYDVLSAFKTGDPNGNSKADEIPFINTSWTLTQFYPYFGISNFGNLTLIDGELQYLTASDNFKDFLQYCRKIYKDGLLNEDCFTLELDQQKAIGASGDTLGCFFDAGAFLTVGRDRDAGFPAVMPFEEGIFPTSTGCSIGTFAITDACKYPDIAIAWADQWYSEEGGRLAWMGVENETYKINTDGSWDWIVGEYGDIGTLRANAGIQGSATHPSVQPDLWMKNMSDPNEAKVNNDRTSIAAAGAKPFPTLHCSDEDNKTIASITADIDPYVEQYIAQVVTGQQELNASWDTYITTLKKMGLEQLMTIYTNAYEEATK